MSDLIDTPGLFDAVRHLVNDHQLECLVETGTGPKSSGLQVATRLGLHGYSCDVFLPCVQNARDNFIGMGIYWGESLQFLKDILPALKVPTFFWLDGHCPTDLDVKPGPDYPAYEEIQVIKRWKYRYEKDVIWVDDIAMVDVPGNPVRTPWDVSLAGRRWYGAKEHPWESYVRILEDTHTMEIAGSVLRYEPRSS